MAKFQKSQPPALVDPVYSSVITLLIIVMACVELCDAVTVVDVYRLVQYDLGGVPFGSRLAALNHHAGSSLFSSSEVADLSRTVLILPVRELNLTLIRGLFDLLLSLDFTTFLNQIQGLQRIDLFFLCAFDDS